MNFLRKVIELTSNNESMINFLVCVYQYMHRDNSAAGTDVLHPLLNPCTIILFFFW